MWSFLTQDDTGTSESPLLPRIPFYLVMHSIPSSYNSQNIIKDGLSDNCTKTLITLNLKHIIFIIALQERTWVHLTKTQTDIAPPTGSAVRL